MNQAYYLSYFDSIFEGLKSSKYFEDAKKVEGEQFFATIKIRLQELKKSKNKIYFFGNGASAAFANHMALDFSKNGKILSRSLSDSAILTALANDFSYESAMVEYLKIENVSKEDLVITISSSGNSPNVLNVLNYCRENEIETLSLSGLKESNQSITHSKYSIYVPMKTYGIVECLHQVFLHLILDESMDIFEWNRSEFQNMNAKAFKL
jgi:D-sedoheptulose 7-phosphate isomerase